MANRYRAQVSGLATTSAGYSHLQELTAMDNAYKAHANELAGVRTPASTAASRFDWADAGIGAMSGFAAALALAGTLVFVLRRRVRGQGPRTPTTA